MNTSLMVRLFQNNESGAAVEKSPSEGPPGVSPRREMSPSEAQPIKNIVNSAKSKLNYLVAKLTSIGWC